VVFPFALARCAFSPGFAPPAHPLCDPSQKVLVSVNAVIFYNQLFSLSLSIGAAAGKGLLRNLLGVLPQNPMGPPESSPAKSRSLGWTETVLGGGWGNYGDTGDPVDFPGQDPQKR
jgi:hypothetical protein